MKRPTSEPPQEPQMSPGSDPWLPLTRPGAAQEGHPPRDTRSVSSSSCPHYPKVDPGRTAGTLEAIPETLSDPSRARRADQALRRSRHFIRGPLPLPWFERAAGQPGKAVAVALLIWFKAGMAGPGPFPLSAVLLARFGVGRKAAYRALTALEAAGLIRADRRRGRLPRVTILTDKSTKE